MKIFIDTNVILDILLDRPGKLAAERIVECVNPAEDRLYVSSLTIANIAYIIRKTPDLKDKINGVMKKYNVLPVNDMQLLSATKNSSPDFEDSVQIACAEMFDCDVIITNNMPHYKAYTRIPVMSPQEVDLFLS